MSQFEGWIGAGIDTLRSVDSARPFCSELVAQLESVRDLGHLKEPFGDCTDVFLDKFSPIVINEILNTVTKDENLVKVLNSVLVGYLQLIKNYVFSDRVRFMRTAQKIVTDSTAFFYAGMTQASSFSFSGGNMGYYKRNVKAFANSDFLEFCTEQYKSGSGVSEEISYSVFTFVVALKKHWNGKAYHEFVHAFVGAYMERIGGLEDREFRNCNEKQISSMFPLMLDELEEDDELYGKVVEAELVFSMRMLKSEYLNKKFWALKNLQGQGKLSDDTISKLAKMNAVQLLLDDMHRELVPGFVWLFRTMMDKGFCTVAQLDQFWKFTMENCNASIDSWCVLVKNMPSSFHQEFWRLLKGTDLFPIQMFGFFRKISSTITNDEKRTIVDLIFRMVGHDSISDEYVNAMVLTVAFYISDGGVSKEDLESRCLDLLKQNKHISFALSLMKKVSFYFDKQAANRAFESFLNFHPDIENATDLYLDWLVSVFRNIDGEISEEQSDKMIGIVKQLIPTRAESLQRFFESGSRSSKKVFPMSFFSKIISYISQSPEYGEQCVDLLLILFKELNSSHFETTVLFNELWAKSVTDCASLDECWSYFYKTHASSMADFLARLYCFCKEPTCIPSLVERCIGEPVTVGSLAVIKNTIDIREQWIVRNWTTTNKWKRKDTGVKVSIKGDLACELELPHSIHSQLLIRGISAITLTRPEKFSIRIQDKAITPGKVSISPGMELTIRSLAGKINLPDLVTSHLGDQHIHALVKCLSDSNQDLASAAYQIVKLLPTDANEKAIIESNEKWEDILREDHFWLLKYRLNELGKHAITSESWAHNFVASGGAIILLRRLILGSRLYEKTGLVLEVMIAVIKADPSFGAVVEQSDLQSLGKCLQGALTSNEKQAIFLIEIIRTILQANTALADTLEDVAELLKQTIFHKNNIVRQQATEFLRQYKTKELLLGLLPFSCVEHSQEYFKVLAQCIDEIYDDGRFKALVKLLMDKFEEAGDELYDIPPNEAFVCGMVSILELLVAKEQDTETLMTLLQFLLKHMAFNPRHYFVLEKSFFNLLRSIIAKSKQFEKAAIEIMAKKHSLVEGKRLKPCDVVFSTSCEFRGLRNLGATCYANSTLQQLFAVPEFREAVLSKDPDTESWYFFFQLLFARLMMFPASYIDTSQFFEKWTGWSGDKVNVREQQDAVEFLQLLLDRINDISSPTVSVFQGEIQHDTVGVSVEYKSSAVEKFTTLCMEVGEQNNLEESIDTFLLPDYHNNYKADDLGEIDVQRFHKILSAPNVLILQLKRFDYDLTTGRRIKINKRYLFQHELDLTRAMHDQSEKVEYELSGVIVHLGTASTGHYYSFCKVDDSRWMSFNDSLVKVFDPKRLPEIVAGLTAPTSATAMSTMREDTAYILFYRRKGLPRSQRRSVKIADGLLRVLTDEIQDILLRATLSDLEYAQFILGIDDGKFRFDYMTKCLVETGNISLFNSFIAKCKTCATSDKEFANYVLNSHDLMYKMLVTNENPTMRNRFVSFLCYVMENSDKSVADDLIAFIVSKLSESTEYWRNYDSIFVPLLRFGSQELLPDLPLYR